jgi:hypothetical protein
MDDLERLSALLVELNVLGNKISEITQRPASIGHTGEFIASQIFDIKLEESAVTKAIDGYFQSGVLAGKSVNIKWYGKQESLLDITYQALPDYYLVLAGSRSQASSSRGAVRPWVIEYVYLFEARNLVMELEERGVKIGIASSIRKYQWDAAEIYPSPKNLQYKIKDSQANLLKLFGQNEWTR